MIFLTSDTHFGDPRILRIDRRPFASIQEHDDALVQMWNETVGPDDEVWHLGDFGRRGSTQHNLLSSLNGRKHLMIGNNDDAATISAQGWASTQHYKELVLEGTLVVLCHYPFRTWNQIHKKSVNLHGHSHGKLTPVLRQFDVGVDAHSFRPLTFEAIRASRPARRI